MLKNHRWYNITHAMTNAAAGGIIYLQLLRQNFKDSKATNIPAKSLSEL